MDCSSSDGEVAVLPQMTVPHQEHYFTRVDASSQELERERSAMANLRQDLSFMEHTKRVSLILQSPVFCDELETLIQDQLKKGNNPTNLIALQQISDFMTTTSAPAMLPATPQHGMAALNMSLGMVTPVNDLRGSECIAYERGEKLLRCKLAAFYRLSDLFGWSQLIYNHLTVRLPSEPEHFLIVPFGLLYSEVTASSLVKVNLQGEVMDKGSTNLGVNQAGFTLHSAIYAARPDVKCIVHIHTPAGAAVSAMKRGLLPISPEALALGKVAYHDYQGILVNEEDIQKSLGPESRVLILRNRGLVSVGETVEEAFHYIQNLVTACEIQVRTLANMGGPDNLVMLDPDKYKARLPLSETRADAAQPKWKLGEQQFEALMRMLDNLGYRTGYPYHCPELRQRAKKSSDAELPPIPARLSSVEDFRLSLQTPPKQGSQKPPARPSRSSLGWGDGLSSAGPGSPGGGSAQVWTSIKRGHVKPLLRSLSTGVCVPSCIINCLWSKDDSFRQPGVANQFVPLNTNPKDVQDMRNKIRKQNLQDIKTAGPQSLVLSGAVIERTLIQDAPLSDCTDYIEGLDLSEQSSSPAKPTKKGELVTASKAIIEKEYQPGLIISKAGPNPFNKLTDEELEDYCKEVQRKQKETKESQQEENQSDESSITTSQ